MGIELGWSSFGLSVPLVVTLLALSLSLGRRALPLAWFAVGLLNATVHPSSSFRPDPERPAVLSGRVTSEWRSEDRYHIAHFAVETIRQGSLWRLWRQKVYLALASSVRPPTNDQLQVKGYLRRVPPVSNGPPVDPGAWTFWVKAKAFVSATEIPRRRLGLEGSSRPFRTFIQSRFQLCDSCAESHGVALARALTLGEAKLLPYSWRPCLGRAGLSHLVALSGLHVGLLAALGWIVGAGLPTGFRTAVVATLVVLYLLMSGGRPSLIRAALMLLGGYGSLLLGRSPQPIHGLSCIATGMVLITPELVRDLGFLLTVSATAGILGLAPRLERACAGIRVPFKKPLSVTVAAQIATLPWALPVFHYVAPFSPLWNLAAVPWVTVILLISIVWLITLLVSPSLAGQLVPILDGLADPVVAICELSPRMFQVIPSHLGFWEVLLPIGLLTALLALTRFRWVLLTCSIALMLVSWRQRDPDPQLVLLDVGQGEAIILRDRNSALLIDGGGWRGADIAQKVLLPALSFLKIRRLDGAVLTHPDSDHCGGLIDLARYVDLPVVWTGPGWPRSSCIDQIATLPGSRLGALWSGESLEVGRWRIETIHPKAGEVARGNGQSLVLMASVMGKKVLLTGDIDADAERRLVVDAAESLSGVNILKLAHHGSKTSSSAPFLDRTQTSLALISCGLGNRYGHPALGVLRRLTKRGIPLLRTDRSGAVVLTFGKDTPIRIDLPGSPKPLRR